MNNKNIALVIDSMFLGCTEEQKEKLVKLYREAYTNTSEFKEMKRYLEEYDYYGSVGTDLYNQGSKAIKSGVTQAGRFTKNISIIEYVLSNSKKLEKETLDYINHAEHSSKELYIVNKKEGEELKNFLSAVFNNVCYSVTILYGIKALKDVKIDVNAKALDMLKNITSEMSIILQEIINLPKPYAWKMVRKEFKGANMVHYKGVVFEKTNLEYEDAVTKYKQVTPYLFEPKETSDVLCYGFGNLSNLSVRDGTRVIGATNIVTKLPENSFDSQNLDYYKLSVTGLLNSIESNNVFVLEPERFSDLLNRYFMMKSVKERNTKQICPYCGKSECNHFDIPKNFGT